MKDYLFSQILEWGIVSSCRGNPGSINK